MFVMRLSGGSTYLVITFQHEVAGVEEALESDPSTREGAIGL